jgi:hypothetical protein
MLTLITYHRATLIHTCDPNSITADSEHVFDILLVSIRADGYMYASCIHVHIPCPMSHQVTHVPRPSRIVLRPLLRPIHTTLHMSPCVCLYMDYTRDRDLTLPVSCHHAHTLMITICYR